MCRQTMEVDMEYSHVNVEWNVNGNGNDDLELCRYKIPEVNLFRSLSLSLFLAEFHGGMHFTENLRNCHCCAKTDKMMYSDFYPYVSRMISAENHILENSCYTFCVLYTSYTIVKSVK